MRQKYKGEDVKARLHNTIIRYKGQPYLANIDGHDIGLIDLSTGSLIANVESDDELLDISSVPLGFLNVMNPDYKLAVYLKRDPLRRFKQGVEVEILSQKVLRDNFPPVHRDVIRSKSLADTILGRFPSYKEAVDFITKKSFHSVAISRDIALKRETDLLKVYLKESEVGYIRLGTDRVIVPKTDQSYYHILLLEDIRGWEVVEGSK
jgi:hypothetical protein